MFLSNKVKSIAAFSLLSLGTLGSQALFAPKAQAEYRAPMICNYNNNTNICTVRISLNNGAVADALIVRGRGITIPRGIANTWAINGMTTGNISRSQGLLINSVTIGGKRYYTSVSARMVSSGTNVTIGVDSLIDLGATVNYNTSELILP